MSVGGSKMGRTLSVCGAYGVVAGVKTAAVAEKNGTAVDFVDLLVVAFVLGFAVVVLEVVVGEAAVTRTH
jgi:hypothetical protein